MTPRSDSSDFCCSDEILIIIQTARNQVVMITVVANNLNDIKPDIGEVSCVVTHLVLN